MQIAQGFVDEEFFANSLGYSDNDLQGIAGMLSCLTNQVIDE